MEPRESVLLAGYRALPNMRKVYMAMVLEAYEQAKPAIRAIQSRASAARARERGK